MCRYEYETIGCKLIKMINNIHDAFYQDGVINYVTNGEAGIA